jgi:hypothetical protein
MGGIGGRWLNISTGFIWENKESAEGVSTKRAGAHCFIQHRGSLGELMEKNQEGH